MPQASPIQTSFNAGEFSPRLIGRVDLDKYGSGLETRENFICTIQGPAFYRSGTRFVSEVIDSTKKSRLIPFVFSDSQAYILEFGDLLIRVFTLEGQLLDGGVPVDLVTTYTEAELSDIQFAQSANVLYIVHKEHPPAKIERVSLTSFTLNDVVFYDGPYEDENITAVTMNPSAATGSITITASVATFDIVNDVGRLIRLNHPTGDVASWGFAIINSTTTTVASCTVIRDFDDTIAVTTWRLGSWFPGNFPRTVTFHEQRLVFAADDANPQKFYGGVIGDFENFAPTGGPERPADAVADDFNNAAATDNAYSFQLASDRVNVISWVNSIRNLLIGTVGGVWPVQATSSLEVISPGNINVRRTSVRGASQVRPINVQDSTIYVNRTKRRIMEVAYSFESDSFSPADITILSDHISDAEIADLEYAPDQESIVWAVRKDGELAGLTIDRSLGVRGWHRHVLGGMEGGGIAKVESIAVIPAPDGSVTPGAHDNEKHDQLWVTVKRQINGAMVRSVEFMEDRFPISAVSDDAFFVDMGLTYNGIATTMIAGLDHLEGETVKVLADGAVHPDRVVASGSITLENSAQIVHVGLGYTGTLKTLRIEGAGSQGTSQGKNKRIVSVVMRLDRSRSLQLANRDDPTTDADWDPVLLRSTSDMMGDPPPLFSGDLVMEVDVGWSLEGQIQIRQTDPVPATILSLGFRTEATERGFE